MKFKDIKYNIMYKLQKAKKGYCDEDLFSINDWFIKIFPKMLGEFIECTCGYPCYTKELKKEVKKMPEMWVEKQREYINKVLKKYNKEFDINNDFCCWLLILLRMKHCFEMCDDCQIYYDIYKHVGDYEGKLNALNKFKKEAFYLFEKYFFNLWW